MKNSEIIGISQTSPDWTKGNFEIKRSDGSVYACVCDAGKEQPSFAVRCASRPEVAFIMDIKALDGLIEALSEYRKRNLG